MTEKTVKTWEWMPKRHEAALGLRLVALCIAGHFTPTVVYWLYCFGEAFVANTQRRDGVLGVIDGFGKATWRMANASDLYRSGGIFVFCVVIVAAWCGFIAFSDRGVPQCLLRRCPRG
ncbi:MAG: hypothetical protein U0640_12000 [Phycisphaerales bacterium]